MAHTLYDGNASRTSRSGRLLIIACPAAEGLGRNGQWLVQFIRWGKRGKELDQCAWWMPSPNAWDRGRCWHPIGSRLIPPEVLADVENWLRARPVGEVQSTTTEAT